ncbi:MAG: holo-ACP synthase [Opitutales bacterium]|nr:holo-ACP synthase [Opitutales bacterium]
MDGLNLSLPPAGKVLSVGIDLVECARLQKALDRQGELFLKKVFTECERSYCMGMKNPTPYLAARFAAKEAVAKAFTTGIGEHLDWRSIEVIKGEREQPLIQLDAKGQALLEHFGASSVRLSITHTDNYASAIALLLE